MKNYSPLKSAAIIFTLLALCAGARAQEHDAPKFEIGIQYSSLSINLPTFGGTDNAAGFGARATYNLTDYLAVEAEGNIYPAETFPGYLTGGGVQQAQFGAKVGKRWNRFGLFAKARPGLISFDRTLTPLQVESGGTTFIEFGNERKTHFSMDVGGVMEFYPSRRVLVRIDAGDTIIRYGEHAEVLPVPVPVVPGPSSPVRPVRGETTHNFQFTAGVGFRFGGGSEPDDAGAASQASGTSERRFEVGVQFSSLVLRVVPEVFSFPTLGFFEERAQAEAGFGGRFGYNVTDNLAFEVEGNFYPRRNFSFNPTYGGYPSQVQFGAKYGRRFERFGVFAKARPGFVSFSRVPTVTHVQTFTSGGQEFTFADQFDDRRRNYFSMDVGGVVEFYPMRRLFTRLDLGDTIIRYGEREALGVFPAGVSRTLPAEFQHNLQFTAGLGLRF